jgi:hypothetical protein
MRRAVRQARVEADVQADYMSLQYSAEVILNKRDDPPVSIYE